MPVQAITSVIYMLNALVGTLLFVNGSFRAAFLGTLACTQVWRVLVGNAAGRLPGRRADLGLPGHGGPRGPLFHRGGFPVSRGRSRSGRCLGRGPLALEPLA